MVIEMKDTYQCTTPIRDKSDRPELASISKIIAA